VDGLGRFGWRRHGGRGRSWAGRYWKEALQQPNGIAEAIQVRLEQQQTTA
jgi:hypothetical protein